ncbi:hypothetical protein RIEGSTA812A_PEG_14 [invertebrate metagenome]|uniref:Uncharacterized protein n=1 Tax=invertebrate metagenome TaxID=1711999 RepID=A0A484H5F0_9ZZZZ
MIRYDACACLQTPDGTRVANVKSPMIPIESVIVYITYLCSMVV